MDQRENSLTGTNHSQHSNLEDQLTLLGVTKNFFKLMRLFVFLFLTLHVFACLYWRVKVDSAAETVEDFLASRNVHHEVSEGGNQLLVLPMSDWSKAGKYSENAKETSLWLLKIFD
jgi:hypothetical protein